MGKFWQVDSEFYDTKIVWSGLELIHDLDPPLKIMTQIASIKTKKVYKQFYEKNIKDIDLTFT